MSIRNPIAILVCDVCGKSLSVSLNKNGGLVEVPDYRIYGYWQEHIVNSAYGVYAYLRDAGVYHTCSDECYQKWEQETERLLAEREKSV